MLDSTISLLDIVKNLVASFLAEVNIKVRKAFSFNVEKPLKNQAIGYGVDLCDPQAVCCKTAGSGATSRANRYPFTLCPVNEIGNNQKVTGKLHLLDDPDFMFQPVAVGFFKLRGEFTLFSDINQPFFQPFT